MSSGAPRAHSASGSWAPSLSGVSVRVDLRGSAWSRCGAQSRSSCTTFKRLHTATPCGDHTSASIEGVAVELPARRQKSTVLRCKAARCTSRHRERCLHIPSPSPNPIPTLQSQGLTRRKANGATGLGHGASCRAGTRAPDRHSREVHRRAFDPLRCVRSQPRPRPHAIGCHTPSVEWAVVRWWVHHGQVHGW